MGRTYDPCATAGKPLVTDLPPAIGLSPGTNPATRWLVLAGAVLVQLILGTVYGYSIFWEPLQADVFPVVMTQAQHDSAVAAGQDVAGAVIVATEAQRKVKLTGQQSYLKYAFSICILSFAAVMVLAGRVQDLKGPRFTAIIGAVLMGLGFITAGLMTKPFVFYLAHAAFTGTVGMLLLMVFEALFGHLDRKSFPILQHVPLALIAAVAVAGVLLGNQYVGRAGEFDSLFLLWGTVGFLAGAGIGFAYVCPIAALIKWFPDHKGLVSGVAVAGFGFGAYLFKGRSIGALGFIEQHGIAQFFLVHGAVCFVAVTAGALLLRNPPSTGGASRITVDSSWQETLRRPVFYVLWLMFFSGAMAGLMVIGIVKVFAGEQLVAAAGSGIDQATTNALLLKGAEAVGWLAIFNAAGRLFWGFASDRMGRTTAFVVMFVLQAGMMFVLAGLDTELSLAVGASIVGFNFGGNFALFPSATADLFGAKNLGANYGWVFTSYGVAGVVGIAAGNAAKTMTGSYAAAFVVAGCLCLISAGLAVGLEVSRRQRRALPSASV
ncbi:MAG: OFA family MFS transporter [Planctomycetota bacterium]|jgi:OFA family oxalate/formate antiporter-like MFS transporter